METSRYIVKHRFNVCLVKAAVAVLALAGTKADDYGCSDTAAIEATSTVATGEVFQSSFKRQVAGDKLSCHVDGFRVGYTLPLQHISLTFRHGPVARLRVSPVSRLGEDRHQEERDQAESLHGSSCPKEVRNFGVQFKLIKHCISILKQSGI